MALLTRISLFTSLLGLAAGVDTSGCGKPPARTGASTSFNVTSSGTSRDFLVRVPSSYDKDRRYPVVLAFSGNTETAWQLELDTRLSDPKWSSDKLLVYPEGINASWAGASYSKATITQDLQFVSDLLANLGSTFCIDSNKIYATGFSNGGGFVDILACSGDTVGSQFAAFVAASGAYYQEALYTSTYKCVPAKSPTPIAFIHGLNDSSVFYNGGDGEGGFLPAVPAVVNSWVSRNRCTSLSKTDSDNGTIHLWSWTCNGVEGALEHHREDDMGHVWASRQQTFSQIVMREGPTSLEANDIIMGFFDRFSLDKQSTSNDSSTFTPASSVLLPVTQATGAGSLPTGTATGTGGAGPTPSGNGAARGWSGVGFHALLSSVGVIVVALLWS